MGEDHRVFRRAREGDRALGRGRRLWLRAVGQGGEGGGGGRDGLIDGDVADNHDLQRAGGEIRRHGSFDAADAGTGDVFAAGKGPAAITGVQQRRQIAGHDAAGGGFVLVVGGFVGGLDALKRLVAPGGFADEGGQDLQLGRQVLRAGAAREYQRVVGGTEAAAVDLGGQRALHVLHADFLEAALDQRAGPPERALAIRRQAQQALTDVHAHQHLVVSEGGRLDAKPRAVGKPHKGGPQVLDLPSLDHLADGPKALVGPGDAGVGECGGQRHGLRGGEGGQNGGLAALDRRRRRHEHQRALTLKDGLERRVDGFGFQIPHGGFEGDLIVGWGGDYAVVGQ